MESDHESMPVTTAQQGSREPPVEEYEQYKRQARGEYKQLMIELEFRCGRAALMNYKDGSYYSWYMPRLEIVAAILGAVSLTTIDAWYPQKLTDSWFSNINQLRGLGVVGLVIAFIIELISKGSPRIIPSFSRRAETHTTAAAAWQALAQKTRSYRIQLDNPKLDVPVYAGWYDELITEREKICAKVITTESTYEKYNDPELLFQDVKQRRHLLQKYLELKS